MSQRRSKQHRTLTQKQKEWRKEAKQRFVEPEQLDSKEPKTEISWDPAARDQTGFGFSGLMTWNCSVARELLSDPDFDVSYVVTQGDETITWSGEEIDGAVVELYGRAASEVPLTTGELLWRLSKKVEFLDPERLVVSHLPREVEGSA